MIETKKAPADLRADKLREYMAGQLGEVAEQTGDNTVTIEECVDAIIELAGIIGGEE